VRALLVVIHFLNLAKEIVIMGVDSLLEAGDRFAGIAFHGAIPDF